MRISNFSFFFRNLIRLILWFDNIKTLFSSKQKTKNVVWNCTNTMKTVIVLFFVYNNSSNSSNALRNTTLFSISINLQCGQMSRSCSHLSTQVLHPSIFLQHDAIVVGDTDIYWNIKHLKQVLALFRSSSYLFMFPWYLLHFVIFQLKEKVL